MRPKGVRTVDGSFNNLALGQSKHGASEMTFPRLLEAEWRQADPEAAALGFEPEHDRTDGRMRRRRDVLCTDAGQRL